MRITYIYDAKALERERRRQSSPSLLCDVNRRDQLLELCLDCCMKINL